MPVRVPHPSHVLRGPSVPPSLTIEQRDELLQWLSETAQNEDMSPRELAQFIAAYDALEAAVLRRARSAALGRFDPSSTAHAVALLGVRRVRQMIRTLADSVRDSRRAA